MMFVFSLLAIACDAIIQEDRLQILMASNVSFVFSFAKSLCNNGDCDAWSQLYFFSPHSLSLFVNMCICVCVCMGAYCGGGFFPRLQGFLRECSTIRSLPAFFFFFFKVEISLRALISLFRPGSVHSGSVNRDNCDRVFPDELRVSSFPDRFPRCAWTAA